MHLRPGRHRQFVLATKADADLTEFNAVRISSGCGSFRDIAYFAPGHVSKIAQFRAKLHKTRGAALQ
jgi:hypothetical protein